MLKHIRYVKIRSNICIFYITYNVINSINWEIVFQTALFVFQKKTNRAKEKTCITPLWNFHLHRSIPYSICNTFVAYRLEAQLSIHFHGIRRRINRKHADSLQLIITEHFFKQLSAYALSVIFRLHEEKADVRWFSHSQHAYNIRSFIESPWILQLPLPSTRVLRSGRTPPIPMKVPTSAAPPPRI